MANMNRLVLGILPHQISGWGGGGTAQFLHLSSCNRSYILCCMVKVLVCETEKRKRKNKQTKQ